MPAHQITRSQTSAIILAPRLAQAEGATLVELSKLLEGLHIDVLHRVTQRSTPLNSPHLLGRGKLEELQTLIESTALAAAQHQRIILVVAADITPAEQRHLEKNLPVAVFDRTAIILRLFEERAQTALAHLEVALARARYELPRVRDNSSLGDREGGGGRAARGHSNVELKKQQLRNAIVELERRIEEKEGARVVQSKARQGVFQVALVGYTNAGKSSLLSALCGSETYIADKPFATLSTTVRALPHATPKVLVSDTIGFMRALPHELLRSFRSTLNEAATADLRLVVVDASDPDWKQQLDTSRRVLDDLHADPRREILVFNKIDRLDSFELDDLRKARPRALFISAHNPEHLELLQREIQKFFAQQSISTKLTVPFHQGKLLARLHAEANVLRTRTTRSGIEVEVQAPAETLARLGVRT